MRESERKRACLLSLIAALALFFGMAGGGAAYAGTEWASNITSIGSGQYVNGGSWHDGVNTDTILWNGFAWSVSGTGYVQGSIGGTGVTGTITVSGSGQLRATTHTGSLNIVVGNTGQITGNVTVSNGGNFTANGSNGVANGTKVTYQNGGGNVTVSGSSNNLGDIEYTNGAGNLSMSGNSNTLGDVTFGGGGGNFDFGGTNNTVGDVSFAGTGNVDITGTGVIGDITYSSGGAGGAIDGIRITGSVTVGDVEFGGDANLVMNSGSTNSIGSYTVTNGGNGDVTLSGSGKQEIRTTVDIDGNSTINITGNGTAGHVIGGAVTVGGSGSFTMGGSASHSAGDVSYGGNATVTLDGSGSYSIGAIDVDGSGGVRLDGTGSHTVAGDIDLGAGNVDILGAGTKTVNGDVTIDSGGTVTVDGIGDHSIGDVTIAANGGNLYVLGSGDKTVGGTNITGDGIAQVTGTGIHNVGDITFTGQGNVTVNAANATVGKITTSGNGSSVTLTAGNSDEVTMNGTGNFFILNGAVLHGDSTIEQSNDIRLSAGMLTGGSTISTNTSTYTNDWYVSGSVDIQGTLNGGGATDNIYVTGGKTELINTANGENIVYLQNHAGSGQTGQIVRNITGGGFLTGTDIVHVQSNYGGAHFVNTITDVNQVYVYANSRLEIGQWTNAIPGPTPALVKVDAIDVYDNAEFLLHRANVHAMNTVNTIDGRGVGSLVWIDKTEIIGEDGGGLAQAATVTMHSQSMLSGFNVAPGSTEANVHGTVLMKSSSVIKPYLVDRIDPIFWADTTGLVAAADRSSKEFKVTASGDGSATDGQFRFEGGAMLESRIFALGNGNFQNVLGDTVDLFHSDYIRSDEGVFHGLAKYNPVFGNAYELPSKWEFKMYEGNGYENTYYFKVMETDGLIIDGAGNQILDPNKAFDPRIIKSDMLGEWVFEYGADGTDIYARFRLLAKHPTEGGIAIDMKEPNAANAARQLDRIRYPFDHNDLGVRYNGDMNAIYSADRAKYPNYHPSYIADFEDLLLNIQEIITDQTKLNQAIRRLHPEPYADLANINLNLMDQFVRTREQHSITALFEVMDYSSGEAEEVEGSNNAYASLDEACAYNYSYVSNPIRFWAAGFGTDANQRKNGTEYGYDTEIWGGAIGMVKEWGDVYLGVTGGFARVDTDWKELHASAKTDAFMADAVLGYRRGMAFFEAYGNFGYSEQSTTRDININRYQGIARGEYHDLVYGGGIRIGYQHLICDDWLLVPTIGVNYTRSESGSFTEEGRDWMSVLLDFEKGDIKRQNVKVPFTVRLAKTFAFFDYIVTPEVRAGATLYMGDKRATATTRFVGDPSGAGYFSAVGVETGRYEATLGASVELSKMGRFHVNANYDYYRRKKADGHNYSLMMGLAF